MNNIGFWISLQRLFLLLLLLAPVGIHTDSGRGNCRYVQSVTLKFICHGYVPKYIFSLYHDYRAPENTPYSVWQSEATSNLNDMVVLISFHENHLHIYDSMRVENLNPRDGHRTFTMKSAKGTKSVTIEPSLLYCFPIGLRYPMELRSSCLGHGRSSDVAAHPVLHYAIRDLRSVRRPSDIASSLNPSGILMIVASTWLVLVGP